MPNVFEVHKGFLETEYTFVLREQRVWISFSVGPWILDKIHQLLGSFNLLI